MDRKTIIETAASRRDSLEEDARQQSKAIGRTTSHPLKKYSDAIGNPSRHRKNVTPQTEKRDKSQLLVAVSTANPENQRFDPRRMSYDVAVVSRNALRGRYALDEDRHPIVTDEGFLLAATELGIPTGSGLHTQFEEKLKGTSATERTAEVSKRIGQDVLRAELLKSRRRCQITGLENASLLRASHIRPWSDPNEKDRLNPDNALLLAVHLDACFDKYLISFGTSGEILISPKLTADERAILGITANMKLAEHKRHQRFLDEHRKRYSAAVLCT